MSGIHFDDGELQRTCAEESVLDCKEKENESESLAVENFFIEKNNVCDIDFEKRSLDNKEINHFEDNRSRYDMFIVSCALQIGVDVEERKESGTTKCYKVSNSRHKSREPSKIGQKYKQGVQKSLKMRRLFKKHVVGVVPKSSKLFKFSRRRIFRKEYICFKYSFACNQRRKEVFKGDNCYIKNIKRRTRNHKERKCNCLFQNTGKGYTEVFLDCSHKYCWCKRMLSNDVEINPGPSFVNYSNTVRGTFDQGNEWLFGNNVGNQCVANGLIAVVF